MPLSHTCSSCGLDLTRIAAPRDAIYNLPIVVCPECRVAAVRRSDGHRALSREQARTMTAGRQIVGSALAWVFMGGALVGAAALLSSLLNESRMSLVELGLALVGAGERDGRYQSWIDDMGPVALVLWGLASVGAGAFVAEALPHVRRWVVVGLLVGFLVIALLLPGTFDAIDSWEHRQDNLGPLQYWARHLRDEFRVLGVLVFSAAIAPLGIPLGLRFRRGVRAMRRRRWNKLRARIKKRRMGS